MTGFVEYKLFQIFRIEKLSDNFSNFEINRINDFICSFFENQDSPRMNMLYVQ